MFLKEVFCVNVQNWNFSFKQRVFVIRMIKLRECDNKEAPNSHLMRFYATLPSVKKYTEVVLHSLHIWSHVIAIDIFVTGHAENCNFHIITAIAWPT